MLQGLFRKKSSFVATAAVALAVTMLSPALVQAQTLRPAPPPAPAVQGSSDPQLAAKLQQALQRLVAELERRDVRPLGAADRADGQERTRSVLFELVQQRDQDRQPNL